MQPHYSQSSHENVTTSRGTFPLASYKEIPPSPPWRSESDWLKICVNQGGLATAFDLAAFRLSMIAPVKKSVNHSRTVASMRETGWEQQQHQEVRLRSDSTV